MNWTSPNWLALDQNNLDSLNSFWTHRRTKKMLILKFICSEKAIQFCKVFTLLLTVCTVFKSKVKISQNFVAFSKIYELCPLWGPKLISIRFSNWYFHIKSNAKCYRGLNNLFSKMVFITISSLTANLTTDNITFKNCNK